MLLASSSSNARLRGEIVSALWALRFRPGRRLTTDVAGGYHLLDFKIADVAPSFKQVLANNLINGLEAMLVDGTLLITADTGFGSFDGARRDDRMGGTIRAQNHNPLGAAFVLNFPISK